MPNTKSVILQLAVQGLLSEHLFFRLLGEVLRRKTLEETNERDEELAEEIAQHYPYWHNSPDPFLKSIRSVLDIEAYVEKHTRKIVCC